MEPSRTPRIVLVRRRVLAGGVALALTASPLLAAGEGSEAGEGAALEGLDATAEFLTLLGLFEAQHRIVAGLYGEGEMLAAQEHLAASHHAFYDDLVAGLARLGAVPFAAEAGVFAGAVVAGAERGNVRAVGDAVFAAIKAARDLAPAKDRMEAAEALLKVAAGDIAAGVQGGTVELPQEYRDAWGFSEVAGLWLADLADGADPEPAAAAASALNGMADVRAQFAGLTATAAPGDPGAMVAAAARVELAAYRLK